MAHKKKWDPEKKNRGQCKEALERIKVATKNMTDPENWNSLLEKCIKNVYI